MDVRVGDKKVISALHKGSFNEVKSLSGASVIENMRRGVGGREYR